MAERTDAAVPAPADESGEPAQGPTTATRSGRFDQLDALRGLAALTVVFGHCMRVVEGAGTNEHTDSLAVQVVKNTPLHLVWAGHQAVMFFFVLSGFVLSLPFIAGRNDSYGVFVVRRICRIWIPYIVVIAAALAARVAFVGVHGDKPISPWVDAAWNQDLNPLLLLNHATLIGSFDDRLLDPVVWSLTIELRISLIFPLLLWLALRYRWQLVLPASFVVGAIGYGVDYKNLGGLTAANLGRTVAFIPLFVVGILMAKHRSDLQRFYTAWVSRFGLWTMLAAGVVAYTYPYWALPQVHALHLAPPDDWATTVGVVLFMIAALGSPAVIRVLTHRIPMWLGRISYSLYLIHAVVLLSFVHLLYGEVPLVVIWALTVAVSLVLATIAHRWVELPAITFGKRITQRSRAARAAAR